MDDREEYSSVACRYPLHAACAKGDAALVNDLIHAGHQVNETNFDLVQPLHEACFRGSIECVQQLLNAGAQVNGRNIDGATPLSDACSSGSVECVKMLLTNGADVNPQLLLSSPLHEAVLRDKWECASLLVDAGANLNHTDCHFGTPLHAAVFKGSINSAKVLLKAGCNVNSIKILSTPLHTAARQQDYNIALLLLMFGADPTMKDNYDRRAIDVVPSATCRVKQLLAFWENQPRELKFLCRQIVRRHVGAGRIQDLHKLQLPLSLIDYLQYSHIIT